MRHFGSVLSGAILGLALLTSCPNPATPEPPAPPPVQDTTAPDNVSSLGGSAGDSSVTLTWTDPADADFSKVRITWTPTGGSPAQPLDVTKGVATAAISSLTNGTEYTFTVRSLDTTSNISAGVTTKLTPTSGLDVTPPGEVTGLNAAAGDGQISLTWTDPTDGDLDEIVITWTPTGGSTAQPLVVSKVTQTATITGLTNGTEYTFTVKTRDTSSNTSTGLSDSATPTASPDVTAPSTGSAISFSGTTSNSTTVSWGASSDLVTSDANLQYKLVQAASSGAIDSLAEADAISGADLIMNWKAADLSETVSGLSSGTTYFFAVLVRDEAGNKSLYTPQSVTTSDVALVAVEVVSPSGTSVNPNGLSISIRFNKSLNTSVKGFLEYDHVPRIYKTGAAKFAPGTMAKMEVETVITFTTTNVSNDTVVFTPLYGYAYQTYANPKVGGFTPASGTGMSGATTLTHSFTTNTVTMTDALGSEQWNDQNIYFMLTDRFNNASTANDQFIMSGDPDHIAGNGKTYQGGDFTGITAKLEYLDNLGITAIWITAPVLQAWENATYASYHGYWAQDFMAVDPHLGTMKDFRDMVDAAHTRGIKVIMDVVVNHVGSLFNYPNETNQWNPVFKSSGTYDTGWLSEDWAKTANRRAPYFGDIGGANLLDFFTRKGGNATAGSGEEIFKGDFDGLRDVDTTNATVRTRLTEIFKWWIANTDIDGLRIDTVKHVEADFWTAFCGDIRTWAKTQFSKDFYMVAEVYSGTAALLGEFTNSNKLDSVLGFQMNGNVFDWNSGDNITLFKDAGTWSSRPKTFAMESVLLGTANEANLNANSLHTNGDGLTARQKLGYFIDNHDLNRFLNGSSDTANEAPSVGEITNLRTALAWLYTWEGIPVLYYGTEQNYKQSMTLASGGEMGSGTGNLNKGNRPNLWQVANSTQNNSPWNETNDTFRMIAALNQARQTYPELRRGYAKIVWTDNDGLGDDVGILAYLRHYGATPATDDDILIVINTHPTNYSAASFGSGNDMKVGQTAGSSVWGWGAGVTLVPVSFGGLESTTPLNSTLYNSSNVAITPNETTTFAQVVSSDTYAAVYFNVPPQSITILKKN